MDPDQAHQNVEPDLKKIYYNRIKKSCEDPEGETGGPDPLKNHKNIGLLRNTGPDPLKNHKATKPAFNVGPTSASQRNPIELVFCWQADDGPLIVLFGSFLPSSTKKKVVKVGPPLAKLSGSAHDNNTCSLNKFSRPLKTHVVFR